MTLPSPSPGQNSGHPTWAELLDFHVRQEGSLSAVAVRLAESRGLSESLESVEKGLRRLRERESRDGGVWGNRLLSVLGLPVALEERVRWMGLYHSRFTDIPRSLAEELLAPYERPPVSESPARVWLRLARASICLRRRDFEGAEENLRLARRVRGAAAVEIGLVTAFLLSRRDGVSEIPALLREVEARLIEEKAGEDADCWRARLVDQQAWLLNVGDRAHRDHAGALQLYQQLPEDGPAFARCRRANGMAWSCWNLGRREEAIFWAREGVKVSGDAGFVRLRAMALAALGRFLGEQGAEERRRAVEISARLEDEELRWRWR